MTPEPYRTLAQASKLLGIPTYALRRAVKRGEIQSYQPFSKRWFVKVSEVEAAIQAADTGEVGQ